MTVSALDENLRSLLVMPSISAAAFEPVVFGGIEGYLSRELKSATAGSFLGRSSTLVPLRLDIAKNPRMIVSTTAVVRCARGRLRREYPLNFVFKSDVDGPIRRGVQEVALVYGFWFGWKALKSVIKASGLSSSEFVCPLLYLI